MSKTRKDRSDIQVGNLEKKHKLEPGTIRNTDHTDARSDKELGTLQREYGEQAMEGMFDSEENHSET
ncbi:hypothetical protein [Spirosoma sp.]|uniref:hypothetical protein n=1 Tax=Spirosoma sp. TaxID=1899569 RepID=UPI003B3A14F1